MVSIEKDNIYQLRQFLLQKVLDNASNDPFKSQFLLFLKLPYQPAFLDFSTFSLYQKCAVSGLSEFDEMVSVQELSRLLGQAARIDSTPMPWVSDIFGVMAIKWLTEKINDKQIVKEFDDWSKEFLTQQVSSNRFNSYERDIATYIGNSEETEYSSASIPLFLHYRKIQYINDQQKKMLLIEKFMNEFRMQAIEDSSTALLSLMIYVFDQVNQDIALIPPNSWTLNDLLRFLEHIPTGLKRWTYEETSRTKGSNPIKWHIQNEYHVQNLLYTLLAPIFNDIADEVYLQPVGQKTPRIDIYLPSMHTIIEVKYRKDTKKSFQSFIGEVGEDASLYRSDLAYADAKIITFLWDNTRSTQEHDKFKEGVNKIPGIDGCVVINAPSTMK